MSIQMVKLAKLKNNARNVSPIHSWPSIIIDIIAAFVGLCCLREENDFYSYNKYEKSIYIERE